MTSSENSVSEPPNMKIFWGRIPTDPPTKFVPCLLIPLDTVGGLLMMNHRLEQVGFLETLRNKYLFPFCTA